MKRSVAAIAVIALVVGAAAADRGASRPAAQKPKAHVVVFDFDCPDGNYGRGLADSLRLRLARHAEYEVIDPLTTRELSGPVGHQADRKKVLALMTDKLGANLGLYGTVLKSGPDVRATIRCIDLRNPDGPTSWQKLFTDGSERARGLIARRIVETVTGKAEWTPPQYGDEPEPKNFAKPLNVNGDFETGCKGWQRPDNVSTFIEDGPKGRGKILRVRTDLERDPWLEYTRRLRLGLADPNEPPDIRRDTSYASVAGLEGVHYRSDWIKAEPGRRYWLVADVRGPSAGIFFPKVFLKGFREAADVADGLPEVSLVERKLTPESFAKLPPEKREEIIAADARSHPKRYRRKVYDWYLPCRNAGDAWKHYAAPVPPRGGLPANVEWLQIQVYSYWPPGQYLWDNVFLYKDPNQAVPLPEEKPRTPGLGKTGDVRRPIGIENTNGTNETNDTNNFNSFNSCNSCSFVPFVFSALNKAQGHSHEV